MGSGESYTVTISLDFEEILTLSLGTVVSQFGEIGTMYEKVSLDFIIVDDAIEDQIEMIVDSAGETLITIGPFEEADFVSTSGSDN